MQSDEACRRGRHHGVSHEAIVAGSPVNAICGETQCVERLAYGTDEPGAGDQVRRIRWDQQPDSRFLDEQEQERQEEEILLVVRVVMHQLMIH